MRLSPQTKQVLTVILDSPTEETYGYAIAEAAGLKTGSAYPILQRLVDEGWLASRWEEVEERSGEARRRRRYYRLTGKGQASAENALRDQRQAFRMLTPGWPAQTIGWSS